MLDKYKVFVQQAIANPRWGQAYLREHLASIETSLFHRHRIVEYQQYLYKLEDGISCATGVEKEAVPPLLNNAVLVELRSEIQNVLSKIQSPIPQGWNADFDLAQAVYCITRLLRPDIVVETGVAHGVSSAFILQALADNNMGQLYSIDLPALFSTAALFVGTAVPERLKHRWTLIPGDSRYILPRLLHQVGQVNIFLHDSSHTYRCQLAEYSAVWPCLQANGVLLSDDLDNDAFIEFAETQGVCPIVIAQPTRRFFGILAMPKAFSLKHVVEHTTGQL